jgi:hypothetical protein
MNARLRAAELPDGLTWVNVSPGRRLAELRGRVVLLHFFTYSNINSLHNLQELRYLENKYHDGMTVLGIHTPKFTEERNAANVLKAVNRTYIRHPVASDPDFLGWQTYGARAWPSIAVIDPEGQLVGIYSGEGRRGELDALVGRLLDDAAAQDARVYEPAQSVSKPEPKMPLRFPGKVVATDNMLYVSDSGHNRILETTHEGRILRQFGSGNPGFWDGRGPDAGFADPQGLAVMKEFLFVADRGNHAIRRIRLISGEVETVAGTGTQGRLIDTDLPDPHTVPINSPWDLAVGGDRLFIAMAGQHQVWSLDLVRHRIGVYSGTGRPGMDDAAVALGTHAKPSGLSATPQALYVADADASAVRTIRTGEGMIKTLVGGGLYEFGDVDGPATQARLQHPMGVSADSTGSILWVADTFNNKVKALSLRGGSVKTLQLTYRFHEPGGIHAHGNSLWVANTNAHEIVRIDTGSGVAKRVPVGE